MKYAWHPIWRAYRAGFMRGRAQLSGGFDVDIAEAEARAEEYCERAKEADAQKDPLIGDRVIYTGPTSAGVRYPPEGITGKVVAVHGDQVNVEAEGVHGIGPHGSRIVYSAPPEMWRVLS